MFPTRDLHFVEKPIEYKLNEDGSNKSDFYCADVLGSKRFVNNFAGFPRSDLALINSQTDMAVARAMAAQLETFDSAPANVGLTDDEILMTAKSKYCQSPSEQIKYYEQMIDMRDARKAALEAKKKAAEEKKIVFDEPATE